MNFSRNHLLRFLLPLALAAGGAAVCAMLVPGETAAVQEQLVGFPDSDFQAHHARPLILAGLCFLPALAAFLHALGGTLDRYITRQFAGIFAICLGALLMIWLLMDMADKIGEFRETQDVLTTIVKFYSARSPAVLLLLLPYSLLLALLLGASMLTRAVDRSAALAEECGLESFSSVHFLFHFRGNFSIQIDWRLLYLMVVWGRNAKKVIS